MQASTPQSSYLRLNKACLREAAGRRHNLGQLLTPWCCPLHCVPKKDDSWRPTGDYRPLNNLTIPDTYPLPHLQSFTDQLHGKRVFSKIDLKDAFQQIPVHPDDIPKTTITTPFGAFQYNYMPFGLSSASQSFQRFIDTALRNITITLPNGEEKEVSVLAFIDDILLASSSHEIYMLELHAVFQRLTDFGLCISPLNASLESSQWSSSGTSSTRTALHLSQKK